MEPALGVDDAAPQTMEREVINVLIPIDHIAAPLFEDRVVFVILAPFVVVDRFYRFGPWSFLWRGVLQKELVGACLLTFRLSYFVA